MHGEDSSSDFRIRDRGGERVLKARDFPIVIGASPTAGIRVESLRENVEAAYIRLAEQGPYVQLGRTDVPVRYNGKQLKESVWLVAGDSLQVGANEIVVEKEDEDIVFTVRKMEGAAEPLSKEPLTGYGSAIEIEPVPFRPSSKRPKRPRLRWLIWPIVGVFFCLLAAAAWFVFTARQVVIRIDPEPDRIVISGGIGAPRWGDYYLLRPGDYTLKAFKECYHPLEQNISVAGERSQTLRLRMERQAGSMTLWVHEAESQSVPVDGAIIRIDGQEVGVSPLQDLEVKAGQRRIEISAANYQDFETYVDIEGCGVVQPFDFALIPGWADVMIKSEPDGASVRVDGNSVGETPLELQLLDGAHELEINAENYKTWHTQLVVKANEPQVMETIHLVPADGRLALRTNPPGANVTVGGTYAGKTPMELALAPGTEHEVLVSKAGYEKALRKITVKPTETKKLAVDLVPIEGVVYLSVEPANAELLIDGKSWGAGLREVSLIAVEHRLEMRKEGYLSFHATITPRPGFPQELEVRLKQRGAVSQEGPTPTVIKAANGYTLKLINPGAFTSGASRREQGRRSNETLRKLTLKRPFYMGVKEVTNREFREFLRDHDSGSARQNSLNRDEQPVVQVTWEQAALFCNWLSMKDSLPPSYVREGGRLVAAEPLGPGYRLPTEAEWEYCARFTSKGNFQKYSWGNSFPPKLKSENFADISAKDIVPNYVENYHDGYPVTAPPGSLEPDALGLFDMGGNVAEWCHDYYSIYPYSPEKEYVDPLGPDYGKHRVVKGASWRLSSISELRLAYRDYSGAQRPDLGFRICRYLTDAAESN